DGDKDGIPAGKEYSFRNFLHNFVPRRRAHRDHDQRRHSRKRHEKVANRARDGCQDVIGDRLAEIAWIYRRWLCPSQYWQMRKDRYRRQQDSSYGIYMFQWVKCHPAQHVGGWISPPVGHPGMCRLMDADREEKHDHPEQNVYVLQGHSELTSILTWGLLPHANGRPAHLGVSQTPGSCLMRPCAFSGELFPLTTLDWA